jgi:uncharacterized protein (TIGR02466 family)
MATRALFPTLLYHAALQKHGARAFNARLLREIKQLSYDDLAGRKWSARNYPGGFTSYGSVNRLHKVSPTFAALEKKLLPHVRRFCRKLQLDLVQRELVMTDCWANIMPAGVLHAMHLHTLSTISGTYYVHIPPHASGLKFEDPRLDRMMAAPPRLPNSRIENRPWVLVPANAGHLILFESWLRHEVPTNQSRTERVSISFNFNWF